MAAQYELLNELLNSGTKLSFGQDFFFKFYQAFLLKDRWMQYINGVAPPCWSPHWRWRWAWCWAAWWRWCA